MTIDPAAAPPMPPFRDLTPDARPAPRTAYDRTLRSTLDALFEAYPTFATGVGFHALDDRWPDLSPGGRAGRIGLLKRLRATAAGLPDAELDDGERIDRGILVDALDSLLFDEQVLREDAWDPLGIVSTLGTGLFGLLGREFAPWEHRGVALAWRTHRLPEVLMAARESLVGVEGRPVSLLHTETALSQLSGVTELIDSAIEEARRRAGEGEADLVAALEAVREPAVAAVEGFANFLDTDVRPRAAGEGRLGAELFAAKLRQTLSSDLDPQALLERAQADYGRVRAEMQRIAAGMWGDWLPGEPLPQDPDELVRRVLDAVAGDHPQPDELLEHCRGVVRELEAFVRDRDLVGLPDEPLRVTWTPTFMRAYGGAFLESPGALDRGQASYFWITPPGDDWPPERVESYLREDNARMLQLLCIHEGVPGHYLQLAWANRCPSLTRSVFASGTFAEGWAVYVTQVMVDVGYGAADPALLLTHWKFYLRAITNAIIDAGIHVSGMTEAEAMDLMVRGGFQEEQEARAKWLRARLTSTQLSTYYVGSTALWDLEAEVRRRAAIEAGAGPEAVPAQRVVGDFGDTPGFDRRRYLESMLDHGTPPIRWLRRILLDG
ncbi:MAG TPA: DUF885 domain-containing protein [Candidatus Limnocylindrales bacterium]|jgi:hypothetical protein|nr:DUF885 domain-containing protein [Candidatus Limnocylindrales bacterium]